MIVRYPNKVLVEPTNEVSVFGRQRLDPIVNLLFEKNKEYGGVGLAHNQLGGQEAIFVIDFDSQTEKDHSYMGVFINPEIVSHSEETITIPERCLSLPGVKVNKERWKTITVRWKDVEGGEHSDTFEGMKSIIFQHEIDHCFGKTIISSLPALKQKMLVEKMRKNLKKKGRSKIKSARQRAKEMGISMPPDAQEHLDVLTGKRMIDE